MERKWLGEMDCPPHTYYTCNFNALTSADGGLCSTFVVLKTTISRSISGTTFGVHVTSPNGHGEGSQIQNRQPA